MGAPTTPAKRPDRLTLILVGGVAIVIAGIVALTVMGGDDDPSPTPTTLGQSTTTEFTGDGTPPDDPGTTEPGPPATTLPEPYGSLGVAAATGCESECLASMTYAIATTDGRREVVVAEGGPIRVRVTITNPTAYEAVLKSATVGNPSAFALQVPADGVVACPGVGDAPLKIAARGDTTCELEYRNATTSGGSLYIDLDYSYPVIDSSGMLDERGGTMPTTDFSKIDIETS